MKNIRLSPDDAPSATPPAEDFAAAAKRVIAAFAPYAEMAGPEGTLAVTAANAAVMAYKLAAGLIADAVARGEITPEQQQAVRAEFEDIRDHLDEKFSGANWQVVPDPE